MTEQKNQPTRAPVAKAQTGQAMVFTLLFAAVSALIALLMFNSGMLVNAKTRLQNAADAGAYSAGVLQARDHNFSAYTNRAIVANQVAVVQVASLKSYLEDAANTHRRMGEATLAMEASIFPQEKYAWDLGKDLPIENVADTFNGMAPSAVQALDKLIGALSTAQELHHAATRMNMVMVAMEVVKKNDPEAQITSGAFAGVTQFRINDWEESTKKHSANDSSAEADRFADVVVDERSTDRFTRKRDSRLMPQWISEVKSCKMLPFYTMSVTTFGFSHGGGSMLSADKKRWLALDATQGAGEYFCLFMVPCLTGTCPVTTSGPLIDGNFGLGDSGGAVVGNGSDYDSHSGYAGNPSSSDNFGGTLINPTTMIPGNLRYHDGPGGTLDSAGGLQDYYRDVRNPGTDIPVNRTAEENGGKFPITFEVERKESSVRTSSKFLGNADKIKLKDASQGGTMRALSSAHAYFYRANSDSGFNRGGWQRADNKSEVANLFNPYWQARLAERSLADRTFSWGAQQ